jgi:uncharacterized protein (TIGR03083 family)
MTDASVSQVDATDPKTKAELLARMRTARARLETILAGLDEATLAAPGPEGWSVKDHLAHLAAWERKVLANLVGRASHEALGVPEAVYKSGDWVQINEYVRAPDKDRPVAEVVAEFRRVYPIITQRVAELPDEQLFGADDSLLNNIAGNTYGHDEEHRPWIEAVLAYKPTT